MVDTNCYPRQVDYVIPANDDASKSIEKILTNVTDAIAEGLAVRKVEKDSKDAEKTAEATATKDPKDETTEAKVEASEAKTEATEAPKAKSKAKKVAKEEAPVKEEE
jgi:small subunit ribosomal protein S2